MSQSLRIAPHPSHPTTKTNTTSNLSDPISRGAPSAPGLPDTLRLSHTTATPTTQITSSHPLESRLSNWTATQASLQKSILRRTFGMALPLRMSMEEQLVAKSDGFRPSVLGPASGVHGDILSGRDMEVQWEDVYNGQDGLRGFVGVGGDGAAVGWTEEMEVKVGMGKW